MAHRSHGTRHGGASAGDALDIYFEESDVLRSALAEWDETRLQSDPAPGDSVAAQKYDNGTLGKLVLEHAALRLAAQRDICRALSTAGRHDLEHELSAEAAATAPLLGRLDKVSRGVSPVSIAGSEEFLEALTRLREALQPALLDQSPTPQSLAEALGEHRRELHGANYIRKHAPTAPAPNKWYDKVPLLLRVHTAFDRGRGFPWAESSPLASQEVSDRYDQETDYDRGVK